MSTHGVSPIGRRDDERKVLPSQTERHVDWE